MITKTECYFFSSNGHLSLGGFDVVSSTGSLTNWERPDNLGLPFNSEVDDYYYVQKKNKSGGFLVSNRRFDGEKTSTTNEDIFEFFNPVVVPDIFARGSIFDKKSLTLVKGANLSLYELVNNERVLLTSKAFADGVYQFPILLNKNYVLEAEKIGYEPANIKIVTLDKIDPMGYGESIYLAEPTVAAVVPEPIAPTTEVPPSGNSDETNAPTSNRKVAASKTPTKTAPKKEKPTTSSKKVEPKVTVSETTNQQKMAVDTVATPSVAQGSLPENNTSEAAGEIYKVQIGAQAVYNATHKRYSNLEEFGIIETDVDSNPGITRLLIGSLATRAEANMLLKRLKKRGFSDAFVVKYQGATRITK